MPISPFSPRSMDNIRRIYFVDSLMYLVNGFWLYLVVEILPKFHEINRKNRWKALKIAPDGAFVYH